MTEQVFIIIFDQLDPGFDPVKMRDFVRDDTRISHWWNHIPNCFLVTTDLGAAGLSARIKKQSGEVGFFVMAADPKNSEGYLPKRSWEWFRLREQERSREPA